MSKRSHRKRVPQESVSTFVSGFSHEGRGIAEVNGKKTFLWGALPDESVTFQYTHCHRQYDEGKVISVENASPNRVIPQCAHFGICGGCNLQHLSESAQIHYKEAILLEHFAHQANTQPKEIAPPIQADPWGYRRKARLSVRFVPKKNKVLVGFREQDSRFVSDIAQCEILDSRIGKKIHLLSTLLMTLTAKAHIPQIEIAMGDEAAALIVRHLEPLCESDLTQLIDFAKQHQLHLYCQPKGPDSIHCIVPDHHHNTLFYDLTSYHIRMYFHPAQFTQVNQAINLKMIDQAMQWLNLQKTDRVLDLFCGIGNFSLPIATQCHHVVGVEAQETSIVQANKNAEHNHIHNTNFYVHDLTQPSQSTPWYRQSYDKILLDPPRAGAKEMMPDIKNWSPSHIVYVSCNPITLARDTKYLLALGYTLEKAGVMDMFPHTQHVEAMALFTLKI